MKQFEQYLAEQRYINDCRDRAAKKRVSNRNLSRGEHKRSKRARLALALSILAWVVVAVLIATVKATAPAVAYTPVAMPNTPPVSECWEAPEIPEGEENAKIQAALLDRATKIENCTVTWYTADTCGKKPGDAAYGITYSGLPVQAGLTCAVDKSVIPLYSSVFVQFSDGSIQQYWATDTGVIGNHVDIYEPDYDTAIQNGRQILTVWYAED